MVLSLTGATEARTLDAMSTALPSESPTGTPLNARLVVELYESHDVGDPLIPVVTIEPVGRFTLGQLDRLQGLIRRELHAAQTRKSIADMAAQKEALHV